MNTFWITSSSAYAKTRTTYLQTSRSITQVRADIYYLQLIAADLRQEADEAKDYCYDETEPLETTACYLLIKYFGYQLCKWPTDAIEVDMLDIWQGPESRKPDIRRGDQDWYRWLYLSRFRPGLLPEMEDLFRGRAGDIAKGFPWEQGYQAFLVCESGECLYKVNYGYFNDRASAKEWIKGVQCIEDSDLHHCVGRIRYMDAEGYPTTGSFQTKCVEVGMAPEDPMEIPEFFTDGPFEWPGRFEKFWATGCEPVS